MFPDAGVSIYTGLWTSFLFTFLAELGDKTFLMVIIYTSKMDKIPLFLSVMLGLALMHSLGSLFGGIFQIFLSQYVLTIISIVSFFLFGVALVIQGWMMETKSFEEVKDEVEKEIEESRSRIS